MIRHCSAGTSSFLLISVFISATNPFVLQLTDPKTPSDTLFHQALVVKPRTFASSSRPISPTRPSTWSIRMRTHHSRPLHRERKLDFGTTEFDENLNELDWLESGMSPSKEANGKNRTEITPLSFPNPTPSFPSPRPKVEFNFSVSEGTKPVLVEIPGKSIGEKDEEEGSEDKIESVPLRPVHILRKSGNADPLSPQVLVTLPALSSPGRQQNETISWAGTQSPLQTFLHQLPTPSTPSPSSAFLSTSHTSSSNMNGIRPIGPGNALRKPKFESPIVAAFLGVVIISILTLAWITKIRDDYFAQIPRISDQNSILAEIWENVFQEDFSRSSYWTLDEYEAPGGRTYREW